MDNPCCSTSVHFHLGHISIRVAIKLCPPFNIQLSRWLWWFSPQAQKNELVLMKMFDLCPSLSTGSTGAASPWLNDEGCLVLTWVLPLIPFNRKDSVKRNSVTCQCYKQCVCRTSIPLSYGVSEVSSSILWPLGHITPSCFPAFL